MPLLHKGRYTPLGLRTNEPAVATTILLPTSNVNSPSNTKVHSSPWVWVCGGIISPGGRRASMLINAPPRGACARSPAARTRGTRARCRPLRPRQRRRACAIWCSICDTIPGSDAPRRSLLPHTLPLDQVDRLCGPGQLRRVSDKWAACCPLPKYEDRSPSSVVYLQTNSWFCFGCLLGGDVIELARHA